MASLRTLWYPPVRLETQMTSTNTQMWPLFRTSELQTHLPTHTHAQCDRASNSNAYDVQHHFAPHPTRLGFQAEIRADMEISLVEHSTRSGKKYMALLDLRSAYGRVNRHDTTFWNCVPSSYLTASTRWSKMSLEDSK